ncbi:MAG TPA: type II secretion system F family protein, partial [Actinomycetota bacterium]|nr:type II secretion system F family protein [Actinomycetota bacterium]
MGRLVAPLVGAVPFCLAAVACGLLRRDALLERAGRVVAGRRVSRHGIAGAAVGRALAVPAGLALGALVASWPGALAGGAAAVAAPVLRRRRREAADRELVETQLIDAVSAVSAGLRAGLSLALAIRAAADEGEPPLAPSLRELVDRTSLGVSFEESLDRWADSMPSEEVRLVAGILGLHRRTGGNAPAVLDQAARTLRERHEAARELRSLTAQARLSG